MVINRTRVMLTLILTSVVLPLMPAKFLYQVLVVSMVCPVNKTAFVRQKPLGLALTFTFSPAQGHDSDSEQHSLRRYTPSVGSNLSGISGFQSPLAEIPGSSEPYPAWSSEKQIPISAEEIEDIFLDLTYKFGFQKDSMRNMVSSFLFGIDRYITFCLL
jgi:hypothetical protein